MSRVRLDYMPQGEGHRSSWGRKDEEFCADFLLVTRRSLTEEEYKIFSYHFLLGADWRLCTRKMKIDRGLFFHSLYRIQQKLGKVYRELKPYALYPLDEYFDGASGDPVRPCNPKEEIASRVRAKVIPIRTPGTPVQVPAIDLRRTA